MPIIRFSTYITPSKQCIIIPPKNSKVNNAQYAELHGCHLRFVVNFASLGHMITSNRSDNVSDIRKRLGKLNSVGNCIIKKLAFCTRVNIKLIRSYIATHSTVMPCGRIMPSYHKQTASLSQWHTVLKRPLGIPRLDEAPPGPSQHQMLKCYQVQLNYKFK